MELVSAIITTHGRLNLFKKALKSAEMQTYPNMEIIVIDDCSADGTKEWMQTEYHGKAQYIYIEKSESKGGNHARNVGIGIAKGRYIAFLDDDDIWMPEKISKQVEIFEVKPEVVLVYCGHVRVFDTGERLVQIPREGTWGDLSHKIFTNIFFTTSMMMIRKNILDEVGGFDEKLKFWQDVDLAIRVCQKGNVGCIPEPLMELLCSTSSNDPTRLSAKMNGWMDSVEYINKKYEIEINKLSDKEKVERDLLIFYEGVSRSAAFGDKKTQRYYFKKIYDTNPTLKNFFKYVFNPNVYHIQRIKAKCYALVGKNTWITLKRQLGLKNNASGNSDIYNNNNIWGGAAVRACA